MRTHFRSTMALMAPFLSTIGAVQPTCSSGGECPGTAFVQRDKAVLEVQSSQPDSLRNPVGNFWDEAQTLLWWIDGTRDRFITNDDIPYAPELTQTRYDAIYQGCGGFRYGGFGEAEFLTVDSIQACMKAYCTLDMRDPTSVEQQMWYKLQGYMEDTQNNNGGVPVPLEILSSYNSILSSTPLQPQPQVLGQIIEALGFEFNKPKDIYNNYQLQVVDLRDAGAPPPINTEPLIGMPLTYAFDEASSSSPDYTEHSPCATFDMEYPCQVRGLKSEGGQCFTDDDCCTEYCLDPTETTPGTCEFKKQLLFKCLWLAKGVDMAESWNCPPGAYGYEGCPRVGDVVKPATWLPATSVPGKLDEVALREYHDLGLIECREFATKCTWDEPGVASFEKFTQDKKEGRYFNGFMRLWTEDYQCKTSSVWSEDQDPHNVQHKNCPASGAPVTAIQAELFGLGPKQLWGDMAEKGLMTCVTQREAYAAWATRRPRAERVLCGGLDYNCFTYEQAQKACEDWSEDPAVPGRYGNGELCFKHELGETVGRNCRFMWTKDSVGKEGCYESNGVNWADTRVAAITGAFTPEQKQKAEELTEATIKAAEAYNAQLDKLGVVSGTDLDIGCHAAAGIVRCQKLPEVEKGREGKDPFPLQPEFQRGFDAACCDRHLSGPYLRYEKPKK